MYSLKQQWLGNLFFRWFNMNLSPSTAQLTRFSLIVCLWWVGKLIWQLHKEIFVWGLNKERWTVDSVKLWSLELVTILFLCDIVEIVRQLNSLSTFGSVLPKTLCSPSHNVLKHFRVYSQNSTNSNLIPSRICPKWNTLLIHQN